jgi:hypothetical protein
MEALCHVIHQAFSELHGASAQKAVLFIITGVRNSDLTNVISTAIKN